MKNQGEKDKAETDFKKAIELDPKIRILNKLLLCNFQNMTPRENLKFREDICLKDLQKQLN